MLSAILSSYVYFESIIYNIIVISINIGHIIANVLLYIGSYCYEIIKTLNTLTTILFEDFSVFIWDICDCASDFFHILVKLIENLLNFTQYTLDSLYLSVISTVTFFSTTYGNILYSIHRIYTSFAGILEAIKGTLLLIGSAVWLLPGVIATLLIIPFHIGWEFIQEVKTAVFNFLYQSVYFGRNVYNFVFDVPVEAFSGLIVIACIFYIILKFHFIVFKHVQDTSKKVIRKSKLIYESLLPKFKQTSKRLSLNGRSKTDQGNTIACIICEDRPKCILILPCKHLCICNECKNILGMYYETCPICRTKVQSTMKVYV